MHAPTFCTRPSPALLQFVAVEQQGGQQQAQARLQGWQVGGAQAWRRRRLCTRRPAGKGVQQAGVRGCH